MDCSQKEESGPETENAHDEETMRRLGGGAIGNCRRNFSLRGGSPERHVSSHGQEVLTSYLGRPLHRGSRQAHAEVQRIGII